MRYRYNTTISIIFLGALLQSCSIIPPPLINPPPDAIHVRELGQLPRTTLIRTITLNNCQGSEVLIHTDEVNSEIVIEASVDFAVDIRALRVAVGATYAERQGTKSQNKLIVPPGKYMEYTISWIVEGWQGEVTVDGVSSSATYRFFPPITLGVVSSKSLACPPSDARSAPIETVEVIVSDISSQSHSQSVDACRIDIDKSNWDQAVIDCDQAITESPSAEGYNRRGFVYANLQRYDEAIADYTHAIVLKPDFVLAYFNRGFAHSRKNDNNSAISDFTEAERLGITGPNLEVLYYDRAIAYHKIGNYDLAISDYTKAIDLSPNDAQNYYDRGSAYSDNHDYTHAIDDYSKVIDLQPKRAIIYHDRALMYLNVGKNKEAIADLKQCLILADDTDLKAQTTAQLRELGAVK